MYMIIPKFPYYLWIFTITIKYHILLYLFTKHKIWIHKHTIQNIYQSIQATMASCSTESFSWICLFPSYNGFWTLLHFWNPISIRKIRKMTPIIMNCTSSMYPNLCSTICWIVSFYLKISFGENPTASALEL